MGGQNLNHEENANTVNHVLAFKNIISHLTSEAVNLGLQYQNSASEEQYTIMSV